MPIKDLLFKQLVITNKQIYQNHTTPKIRINKLDACKHFMYLDTNAPIQKLTLQYILFQLLAALARLAAE